MSIKKVLKVRSDKELGGEGKFDWITHVERKYYSADG
jgi:hypothetical protein